MTQIWLIVDVGKTFLSKGIIKPDLDVDSCKSNLQAVSSTLNMLIQAMIF